MRDPKRIKKLLGLIEEAWTRAPDLRFGQLLIGLGLIKDDLLTWNVEDEEWISYMDIKLKKDWYVNKKVKK